MFKVHNRNTRKMSILSQKNLPVQIYNINTKQGVKYVQN